MTFSRKNWLTFSIGLLSLALVPGLVMAQQSFSGISKRLQGIETRILGELSIVERTVTELTDNYAEIRMEPSAEKSIHSFYDTKTCATSGAGSAVLIWQGGTSWDCVVEDDPTVKSFGKANLPVCTSAQALQGNATKNGDGSFGCANLPAALVGDKPDHQWSGTKVRFETDYGVWGTYTDLRGPKGATAVCP